MNWFLFCFNLDHSSSDEQFTDDSIPLTGGNQENGLKSSSYHQTFPTHVYKESLPSTIYRTGEARSIRVCFEFHWKTET